ncbi:DUF6658 family protein [Aerosakkonemataceae cyanobacterium BLCC-F50]|uniref:DUF6658 family protein n=1 Tax=Floridaenema flaviceps BLCC-F50 TaxID=3153642 RepID=A0ABV4XZF3_9CYAN
MKQIISFLNPTRLFRVLTVFLAGVLVIVTTACSDGPANALDKNGRPEVPSNAVSSPYRGGMNGYSDVDPRANTSGLNSKANDLVNKAEGNIQKGADSFEKYADNYTSGTPLNERVENLTKDIGESTKNTAKDVTKGTQRGVENLKGNTQNAAKSVPNVVEEATQNAKNTARDAAKASDKISNSLKSQADRALDNSQRAFSNHSVDVE